MASMLGLEVDASLAVLLLSKMICSRPCVGTVNAGFLGWKEQQGNCCCPPLALVFFLALADAGG